MYGFVEKVVLAAVKSWGIALQFAEPQVAWLVESCFNWAVDPKISCLV